MSTLEDVRDAIKARLRTIETLNVGGHKGSITPMAVVGVPQVNYSATMGSTAVMGAEGGKLSWPVSILVSTQQLEDGYAAAVRYMEPTGDYSIKAALEGDRNTSGTQTLGGLVHDLVVAGASPGSPQDTDDFGVLMVDFEVYVVMRRDG